MNAVTPLDFLVPTLRVAHDLGWDGHELSVRIEELERLDESRLLALVGMYTEKRRRKQWFDKNLKDKHFAVGDLVLLYTLKKHKRKLKKRGLGPYVIHTILNSGAIKLATLDGEEMSAFINGSRLKKFYEPLTQGMLDQLHMAKTKKEALETLKQDAKEEAKQRKHQMRNKFDAQVCVVNQSSPDAILPFAVRVRLINYQTSCTVDAMMDSGAECNLLSHTTWKSLGQPELTPSSLNLIDFKGERSQALGELLLRIRIQDQAMMVTFHVLPTNGCDYKLLLGRRWMQETEFQMLWTDCSYQLKVNNSTLTGYSAERLDLPSPRVEETPHTAQVHDKSPQRPQPQQVTWIADQSNPGYGWNVKTSLLKAQGYGAKWKDCWVPKHSYQRALVSPQAKPKR